MIADTPLRPLVWLASSRKDFLSFPDNVKSEFGYALFQAQSWRLPRISKPLKGFNGNGVVELYTDFKGGTFRVVYTVRLQTAVYVLHAFQKKSTKGIATAQHDLSLIEKRLRHVDLVAERARKDKMQ